MLLVVGKQEQEIDDKFYNRIIEGLEKAKEDINIILTKEDLVLYIPDYPKFRETPQQGIDYVKRIFTNVLEMIDKIEIKENAVRIREDFVTKAGFSVILKLYCGYSVFTGWVADFELKRMLGVYNWRFRKSKPYVETQFPHKEILCLRKEIMRMLGRVIE